MSEDYEWIDDANLNELVNRFQKMLKADMQFFFDVNEFEVIIDYFIDFQEFDKGRIAVRSALQQHPSGIGFKIRSAKLLAQKWKLLRGVRAIKPTRINRDCKR